MSRHRFFQVDAFTDRVFGGNPAGVVPLDDWLPDRHLLQIAAENCLSETAFYVARTNGYDLRWFTPQMEVDLCGHATLATAHVLFEIEKFRGPRLQFHTRSGLLEVARSKNGLQMTLPARQALPDSAPQLLLDALHPLIPKEILKGRDYLVIFDSEDDVRHARPDLEKIRQLPVQMLIISAQGKHCDFVSRCFAPALGVPEDPVTGAAHCTLTPYWSPILGKVELSARQLSSRGGQLICRYQGSHVTLTGRTALYLQGEINVPGET